MLELTGLGTVLRGLGVLYWMLAIGVIAFALWKGKGWEGKTFWTLVVVTLFGFFPVRGFIEHSQRQAFAREAWAYFRKKCETEAGEKIYKTFTGVKSVLVVKPLPPATEKDLYDQFWYGDPYSASAHSQRGKLEAAILASQDTPIAPNVIGRGFDFVESVVLTEGSEKKFIKYFYPAGKRGYTYEFVEKPVSQFGVSWEDISQPEDRKYWIAASRLRITNLRDNSVVAERIGFLIEPGFGSKLGQRRPWQMARGIGANGNSCPETHTWTDRWFVVRVLRSKVEN